MNRWLVFGRTDYPSPLSCRGELEAPDAAAATAKALAQFGAEWVELSLLPVDAVQWVIELPAEEAT